jgi:ADP-ribose pyrophosphatase YjhB (NUDIX family)
VTQVHLAHALVVRNGHVLLVASRYPNHAEPLWNLPGGRQRFGELLWETAERELFEETGIRGAAGTLVYVNESYDGDRHFVAAVFLTEIGSGELRIPRTGDHVCEAEWVPFAQVASRIAPAVVREPLIAYLGGTLERRYAGRHEAGISIEWPTEA